MVGLILIFHYLGLVDNVGEASSIGFEIDSKIILSDRVSATFAFAKNDAVLTEDYELRGAVEARKIKIYLLPQIKKVILV